MTSRFYLRYAGRKDGAGEVYEIVDDVEGCVVGAPAPRDELAPKCKEMNAGVSKAREAADAWSAPIPALGLSLTTAVAKQAADRIADFLGAPLPVNKRWIPLWDETNDSPGDLSTLNDVQLQVLVGAVSAELNVRRMRLSQRIRPLEDDATAQYRRDFLKCMQAFNQSVSQ